MEIMMETNYEALLYFFSNFMLCVLIYRNCCTTKLEVRSRDEEEMLKLYYTKMITFEWDVQNSYLPGQKCNMQASWVGFICGPECDESNLKYGIH